MKIKTSELTGPALNWAVAKCEGVQLDLAPDGYYTHKPSANWSQGGPIIERECVCVECSFEKNEWSAWTPAPEREFGEAYGNGPTPLIAAMRCYVASKLGDEVEVPEELKGEEQ